MTKPEIKKLNYKSYATLSIVHRLLTHTLMTNWTEL